VTVDRLQAGQLGPYGNTWIDTPELDRLAADSFLLDHATIHTPRLDELLQAHWGDLLPALRQTGVNTTLFTDESAAAHHPLAELFDRVEYYEPSSPTGAATRPDESHLAKFFLTAVDAWTDSPRDGLYWIHSQGMGGPWDAPNEFRGAYADELDPTPPDFVTPPCQMLDEDADPDEILGFVHAYAGQVTLLDLCLGSLLETLLDDDRAKETLFALLGLRGFPLGEHRRVGPLDEALYGELIHVPWFMRLPDGEGATERSQALAQPADLSRTLLAWWDVEAPQRAAGVDLRLLIDGKINMLRDRVCTRAGDQERSIRTPGWHLRVAEDATGPIRHLFAKPDDQWEVNEVADRCPEIVEGLLAAIEEQEQAEANGTAENVTPLDDVLLWGLE